MHLDFLLIPAEWIKNISYDNIIKKAEKKKKKVNTFICILMKVVFDEYIVLALLGRILSSMCLVAVCASYFIISLISIVLRQDNQNEWIR